MSGKPWDNINQNVNWNIDVDTGYKLLWMIGAIFIGVGAVLILFITTRLKRTSEEPRHE